jgi:hypothetical protein
MSPGTARPSGARHVVASNSEVVQRRAEAFHQQGASGHVMPQQPRATIAVSELKHRDFVRGNVEVARHPQLHDSGVAVLEAHRGYERLRGIGKRAADTNTPVSFDAGHQRGEPVEPLRAANRDRFGPHGLRHVDHPGTLTHVVGVAPSRC